MPLSIDARAYAERVRELHNQRRTTAYATPPTCLALTVLLWGKVPTPAMLAWLAVMAVSLLITLASVRAWRLDPQADTRAAHWASVQGVATALSGLAWGSAAWFIWPADPAYRMLLLLFLCGVSAVAAIGTATLKRAFAGLLLPIWGLVILRLQIEPGPLPDDLILLVGLFLLVMLLTAWRVHRILAESIRLRCANLDLIADLEVQKARAESADRAKTGFLAAASHDLRQPVHALGLFLRALDSLVRAPKPDPVQLGGIVAQCRQALGGLSQLLAALLDISRLDAGVVTLQPQAVPLQPLWNQLADEFGAEAQARGLQLRLRPTTACALSDALALKRILGNLLSNALRYTRSGGVLLACRRRGQTLWIEVWDTGPGIPEGARDMIFDEFVQLGNRERNREQGLGLGLAIVRRLARSQGQQVEVDSRLGRGSRFRLVLPAHASSLAAPNHEAPEGMPPTTPGPATARQVVLAIDDDPGILQATSALAATTGITLLTARSLDEALAHPRLAEVTLLVSDHRLPDGVDGWSAVQAVRARLARSVPALLLTGDTDPQRLREATASGLPLLHKPFDADVLLREMERTLAAA